MSSKGRAGVTTSAAGSIKGSNPDSMPDCIKIRSQIHVPGEITKRSRACVPEALCYYQMQAYSHANTRMQYRPLLVNTVLYANTLKRETRWIKIQ